MARSKALGPDPQESYSYLELPIGATAVGLPAQGRRTGLWRYLRPRLQAKIPPCQEACPLGNWIQRFVAAAAAGDLAEAWRALRLENPFPGVCGRVCYHPCQEACNRRELDQATSIRAIERRLADHHFDQPFRPPLVREKRSARVAVVGAGPAGLAGAYFLALLGYQSTVFEAGREPGGIPQAAIPAYRLPRRVLNKEIEDILALGVELRTGCRIGRDLAFADLLADYEAVLLASGAHLSPALGLPGEDSPGVCQGLDFLQGRHFNEPVELGQRILVIGGGNAAIDVSRTLIRLGRSPAILYRRTRSEMPAHPGEIEDALAEGVEIHYLLSPTAIRESGSGGLSLECARMKLEGRDASGRPRAVPRHGQRASFEADQIILATGERPDLAYLPPEIERAGDRVRVNDWGQTSLAKVFAGGDVLDQPWTVAQAVGSAKRAAIALDLFLRGEDLASLAGGPPRTMREHLGLDEDRPSGSRVVAALEDLNLNYCPTRPGREPKRLAPAERRRDFSEVDLGLDQSAALEEAGRCLSCGVCRMCGNCYLFCPDGAVRLVPETGRYAIDYDYCKGCGICQSECPVAAISMETEGEV